ncbi:MAG: hypothetical protein QOE70_5078 [Chthoniobacter sp.]|jgi:hypothetical protein|nr:hypothetical protein [Chthoniobacter sp.]
MPTGIPGADSVNPVTPALIQQTTQLIGRPPQFMGRYFCRADRPSPYEYGHREENGPLHDSNLKLLPVADQTPQVGGSREEGVSDGQGNVGDLLATFDPGYLASLGNEFLVFLDVEGNPSLSVNYYAGWAETLMSASQTQSGGRFTLLPAVYGSRDDRQTWEALQQAGQQGAACYGVWVAAYLTQSADSIPVVWPDWDEHQTTPQGAQLTCPVLLWQYAGNFPNSSEYAPLDCNMTNPAIDAAQFLSRLILPPTQS